MPTQRGNRVHLILRVLHVPVRRVDLELLEAEDMDGLRDSEIFLEHPAMILRCYVIYIETAWSKNSTNIMHDIVKRQWNDRWLSSYDAQIVAVYLRNL